MIQGFLSPLSSQDLCVPEELYENLADLPYLFVAIEALTRLFRLTDKSGLIVSEDDWKSRGSCFAFTDLGFKSLVDLSLILHF